MAMTNFSDLNIRVSTIAGGTAGTMTVTGISTDDVLKSVLAFADGTEPITDLTDEFSITDDDTVSNAGGGTDTTDASLFFLWIDKDATS